MKYSLKNAQNGLSILELMIAMLIGLFLLAGIASSYLSSKKSSVQRNEYSILQDNGRFALEAMTQTIVHSGYKAFPTGSLAPSSFITGPVASTACGGSGGEQSVLNESLFDNKETMNGLSTESDRVGVVYLGDDFVFTDCTGKELPDDCRISNTNTNSNAASIYNTFYIENNNLKCIGSRANDAETLAGGIENMQILYGLNLDADPEVESYVNADQMSAFTDNIVSVQIAVLVRSSREVKDVAESKVYSLLDTAIPSPNDKYMRAVFTTTINLRNTL